MTGMAIIEYVSEIQKKSIIFLKLSSINFRPLIQAQRQALRRTHISLFFKKALCPHVTKASWSIKLSAAAASGQGGLFL